MSESDADADDVDAEYSDADFVPADPADANGDVDTEAETEPAPAPPDADATPSDPDAEQGDDRPEWQTQNGPVEILPPEYNSRFGALGNAWKQYRHNKKQKRIAGSGRVQWYLIDDGWPRPKYVKPERKGGGVREYEHDGEMYLFPREAFLNDKTTGAWTVVHRKGELDPINLQEPRKNALDADAAKEWAELTVTSSAPGFLEGLDISASEAMTYLIFGIIALAVGQQFLGGGF